jgi:photosystem II stability/assembly factor-like uncharacterized protein
VKSSAIAAVIVLALVSCVAAAAPAAARAAAPPPEAAWTIALYANGDNDLMYTWPRYTLPALQSIPPSTAVAVVAMLDTPQQDGARLLRVSGSRVETVKHYTRERDFGSGATFRWFLEQVHARFPSRRLLVVGWDHGYAWHYFSRDFGSGARILLPELTKAIADAGVPIDILGFDACNMADIDVAWSLAGTGLVDHLVASEETVDEDGYPYGNMFTPLTADPDRAPDAVLADMIAGWTRYYGSRRNFNWVSLSAVDLGAGAALRDDLRVWVARLRAGLPLFAARYQAAMSRTIYAWDSWQLDLGGFAARLATDPRITDASLRAASAAVRDDVEAAVTDVTSGSYAAGFTGLTVWAGTGADWRAYREDYRAQVAFGRPATAGGAGWYGFLRGFNASPAAHAHTPAPLDVPGRARYGLSDVYFADASHGWATGFDNLANTAFVLRSLGSGSAWKTSDQAALGNYLFTAVAAQPEAGLWVVGDAGHGSSVVARSATSGRTWTRVRSGSRQYLYDVDFPDKAHGWACGAGGTLLRSTNAGAGWAQVGAPAGDLFALDFTDAAHGWVASNDERYPTARLEYTSDGGSHWESRYTATGALLYGVDAVGDQVWAGGGDPATETGLLVHGGSGDAWETQWSGPARLAAVTMVDAAHGWAVGDGGLILHTEDGVTWTAQPAGVAFDLTAVSAVDELTAWAVGDGEAILRTSDGGAHWSRVPGAALRALIPASSFARR